MKIVEEIYYNKVNWQIIIEYSIHSQGRWLDRKLSGKTLSGMTARAVDFFLQHPSIPRKKRIIVRNIVKHNSLVIAKTFMDLIDKKSGVLKLLIVTVINKIMHANIGELVIDVYKNGRCKIYEKTCKIQQRKMENQLWNNESCSGKDT